MVVFSKTNSNATSKQTRVPSLILPADFASGFCNIEIGFSGGMDSSVLLDLLIKEREANGFNLSAIHVNHNLSKSANMWSEHCEQICQANNIPLRIETVHIKAGKDGLESAARQARYTLYRQSHAQLIALAQHFDDQAETILLQVLRGGGVQALSAMPVLRQLSQDIRLWRPLLSFTREELFIYAKKRNLVWIEDESNNDQRFTRNWLRHSVIPLIQQQQPNYRQSLQRCTEQMADAAAMQNDLSTIDLQHASDGSRLNLSKLLPLSSARQRQLLLRWAKQNHLGTATPSSLEDFRQQLISAKTDRTPIWFLPNGKAHRYQNQLWAEMLHDYQLDPCQLSSPVNLDLTNWAGKLVWQHAENGLSEQAFAQGLVMKLPELGAKISSNIGSKSLKKLFQEHSIPPFLRRRWPVICNQNNEIVAIPSIAIASDSSSKNGWFATWIYS